MYIQKDALRPLRTTAMNMIERLAREEAARKEEEEWLAQEEAARKEEEERLAREEAARKKEEERLAQEERLAREAVARKEEEERLATEEAARKEEEERLAKEKWSLLEGQRLPATPSPHHTPYRVVLCCIAIWMFPEMRAFQKFMFYKRNSRRNG